MRIVVDTNIAFSAILNTDSKIARILIQPRTTFNFYSTEHLLYEIYEHKDKILNLTDYSDSDLDRVITLITKKTDLLMSISSLNQFIIMQKN